MTTKKEEIMRVRKRLLKASSKDKEMQSVIRKFNFAKIPLKKLRKVK